MCNWIIKSLQTHVSTFHFFLLLSLTFLDISVVLQSKQFKVFDFKQIETNNLKLKKTEKIKSIYYFYLFY